MTIKQFNKSISNISPWSSSESPLHANVQKLSQCIQLVHFHLQQSQLKSTLKACAGKKSIAIIHAHMAQRVCTHSASYI